MIAEIADDGELMKLRPDRDHPVTHGFACHKGLSYLDIHRDPDRLDHPLRRTNPRTEPVGEFERVSWEQAFADIGRRLRAIRDRHGADALGSYYGNPIAFNTKAFVPAVTFASRIGTRHCFGASTQDMSNKSAALEAVFGSGQWTIPDFYNTDYLLCIGGNPRISHWTLVSTHRPLHLLENIIERGGKVRFVNPRRIESATDVTGELIQIRPDTDVYFLAAVLCEVERAGGFDEAVIARHGKHIEELRAFIGGYPAERVARVTGIEAEHIRSVAHEFLAARSASTYMATGVNQGRQGTLAYWLVNMLSFVTGNLGRKGGNYYAKGVCPTTVGSAASTDVYFDTPLGEMRHTYGALPGTLLADFIELEDNPVRALIVFSGNPLISMAGEERLRKAFNKLELLISLDLYRNATGELADYVLPAADWLEREDLNHVANGVQPIPYVQYSDAVVPPRAERKDDWWIIARLEQELGLPSLLDQSPPPYLQMIDGMLQASNLSIEALRRMPHQTASLPQPPREDFYDDLVAWPDKRVDCCPPLFAEALERCERIFLELEREDPAQLKIISLRTNYMHNSNLSNMKSLKRGRHALNPLHIHPRDADRIGLNEGDMARIHNANGSVTTPVTLDDTLRPGVVALSHGYGGYPAPGVSLADAAPGVNVNRLLPTGRGSYEKLSNMSHMNGVPVSVERLS